MHHVLVLGFLCKMEKTLVPRSPGGCVAGIKECSARGRAGPHASFQGRVGEPLQVLGAHEGMCLLITAGRAALGRCSRC